jgi:hypothetical protein
LSLVPERARAVELATGTAVWHQGGKPVLPLRWVLVRDPSRPTSATCANCRIGGTAG